MNRYRDRRFNSNLAKRENTPPAYRSAPKLGVECFGRVYVSVGPQSCTLRRDVSPFPVPGISSPFNSGKMRLSAWGYIGYAKGVQLPVKKNREKNTPSYAGCALFRARNRLFFIPCFYCQAEANDEESSIALEIDRKRRFTLNIAVTFISEWLLTPILVLDNKCCWQLEYFSVSTLFRLLVVSITFSVLNGFSLRLYLVQQRVRELNRYATAPPVKD